MIESHFVGIGAQKAGTSWLHRILTNDSRLSFPPFIKEVHYFSAVDYGDGLLNLWRASALRDFASDSRFQISMAQYLGLSNPKAKFAKPRSSVIKHPDFFRKLKVCLSPISDAWYEELYESGDKQAKICVDITPAYAQLSVQGFRHLASVARKQSLFFIMRDPVERSWSGLLQGIKTGRNQNVSLNDLSELSAEKVEPLMLRPSVQNASDYLTVFKNVHEAGLADKLTVAFYDDVKADPKGIISRAYKAMGIDAPAIDASKLTEVVYKSPDAKMPVGVDERLREFFRPSLRVINERYCELPLVWRQKYAI